MRLTTISTFGLGIGVVMAGADLQIDFPGFMRAPRQEQNLQTFTGALGGIEAEPITSNSDPKRPFAVGSDTFTSLEDATVRTCNNQKNACAKIANGKNNPDNITVGQCDDQETDCSNHASSVAENAPAKASTTTPVATTPARASSPPSSPAPPPEPAQPAAVAPVPADPPADPPAPVQQTSAPQEASTPTPIAPVVAAQPTLHSSDDQFFYFCDP